MKMIDIYPIEMMSKNPKIKLAQKLIDAGAPIKFKSLTSLEICINEGAEIFRTVMPNGTIRYSWN